MDHCDTNRKCIYELHEFKHKKGRLFGFRWCLINVEYLVDIRAVCPRSNIECGYLYHCQVPAMKGQYNNNYIYD